MVFESIDQILPFDTSHLLHPHNKQNLSSLNICLQISPPPSPSPSSSEELFADDFSRPSPQEALEQVDSFLKDALNSRNRITVLRLEHEIEKFVRNQNLQQLLMKPMPSSYERLAAHRVAQHYGLQSMVVDSNSPTGSRVLLLKTPDSKLPVVKLVDIPVDPAYQEKSLCPLLEKVAIKQRANASAQLNESHNASDSGRLTPVKSVEERKEEYDKARARIFSSGGESPKKDENEDIVQNDVAEVASAKLKELMISGQLTATSEEREKPLLVDYSSQSANRVAIIRDREKDMKDPDYDRSYDRYSQRMNTGFGIKDRPLIMHGVYHPTVNLNEFSRLHAVGLQHMCPDPAAYSMSRGPWPMLSSGPPNAVYPNAFHGNFPNLHADLRSPHVPFSSQRLPHTVQYLDHYPHPQQQPGLHCKTSFD